MVPLSKNTQLLYHRGEDKIKMEVVLEKRYFIIYELDQLGDIVGMLYMTDSFGEMKEYVKDLDLDEYDNRSDAWKMPLHSKAT